jgi:hypothetical protein
MGDVRPFPWKRLSADHDDDNDTPALLVPAENAADAGAVCGDLQLATGMGGYGTLVCWGTDGVYTVAALPE